MMGINFEATFSKIPARLIRYRWLVLGVYVLLMVLAFLGTEKIWKDDSLKSWFGKDSEIFQNQQKFERYFGSNEDVYIVYEAKDGNVFSEESLKALSRLHYELADFGVDIQKNPDSPLSHTREVLSLVNVQVTKVNGDTLSMYEFIGKNLPTTESERQKLRAEALNNPELALAYVSKDARYGAISVKTDFGDVVTPAVNEEEIGFDEFSVDWEFDESEVDANVTEEVEEVAKDYDAYFAYMNAIRSEVSDAGIDDQLDIYYAGLPELIAFQIEVLDAEMVIIFIGLFFLILITMWVVFRHLSAVIWSMIIIISAVFFTMGIIGWSGVPTSSLSDPMILMVVLIAVADTVHIMSTYLHFRRTGASHSDSLALALGRSGVSCFLTTFTTVIGFGSLWVVKASIPVANFGLFCSVGLMVAFLTTVILLPIMLDIWAPVAKAKTESKTKNFRFSDSLFAMSCKRPYVVIAAFLIVTAAVGSGISNIRVDTNTLETFDESTYLRQAFDIADKNMAGTQNINFMVNLKSSNALNDSEVVLKIAEFQSRMREAFPELIATSVSVADLMKRLNQQLNNDNPEYYRVPETSDEISELLFLFNNVSPEERRRLISDDFDATQIAFSVRNSGSTHYVDLIAKAHLWTDEIFSPLKEKYPEMEVINSGGVVTFMHLFDRMAHSQITSFIITLSLIAITLFFVFKSIPLGLLAVLASVIPIILTFGAMGWLGIDLNPTTMIIAPIILGLAVDDSIHLINKLRTLLPQSNSVSEAVRDSLRVVAPALTFTTVVLGCGMLMMLYSSDSSFQAFGYLSAFAIGSALIADVLLIPAICLLFCKAREKSGAESLTPAHSS